MRHVAFALLVLAGCFYGDPDYGTTRFKCGDGQACPDGQVCGTDGFCGGGSNMDLGVACGAAGQCTTQQKCCSNGVETLCVGLTDTCSGPAAACDGKEDCGADSCCADDSEHPACVAGACGTRACADDNDCTGAAPHCCMFNPTLPWGYCLTISC